MSVRVQVDPLSCQSSGRCVQAAPDAFALDRDHLASVQPASERLSQETLLEIARSCPALAIHVYDEDGNELEL